MSKSEKHSRRRMKVFHFASAPARGPETMEMVGIDESAIAGFKRLGEAGASAGGQDVKLLFSDADLEMSLNYAWFKKGYVLPKHAHNADCIYLVMAGELQMGTQVLRKGDGVFIPKGMAYTFDAGDEGVEVLEFRNKADVNFQLAKNDAGHWDKMVAATAKNAADWPQQIRPSGIKII